MPHSRFPSPLLQSKYQNVLWQSFYVRRHLIPTQNFIRISPAVFMPIVNAISIFWPPSPHFGWQLFAFLVFWGPTDYIYNFGWVFIFWPLPPLGGGGFLKTKIIRNHILYNFAYNRICRRVNRIGVIFIIFIIAHKNWRVPLFYDWSNHQNLTKLYMGPTCLRYPFLIKKK